MSIVMNEVSASPPRTGATETGELTAGQVPGATEIGPRARCLGQLKPEPANWRGPGAWGN